MLLGCILVYSALFSIGFIIYSNMIPALLSGVVAVISGYLLLKNWDKIN
jgi:hypothetical protein